MNHDQFIADIDEAITAGLALLDEYGFDRQTVADDVINMEANGTRLELINCDACVLAAVFGGFYRGLDDLDISEEVAERFGFTLAIESDDAFAELTWQWRLRLGLETENA